MKNHHKALSDASKKVDPFIKNTFSNTTITGPAISFDRLAGSPVMVVCTHRSHLDYMLLGNEFYKLGLYNLRFAAGDNLTNLPYIGTKFLSYGAFSVYRARAANRNYLFELCNQVIEMLNDGDNIIVFPEGGRSYRGDMMEMKYGILAANVIAQYHSPEKQYLYLPVTISYEKLPELLYFEILERGRRMLKQKGGFIQKMVGNTFYFGADLVAFAKLLTAQYFNVNYGEIFIDYSHPVPVNDIVDIKKHYSPDKRNEFFAHKISIQKVGEQVRKWLLGLYRILPQNIVAACLLRSKSNNPADLPAMVPEIVAALQKEKRNCTSLVNLTEKELVEKGVDQLRFSRAVTVKQNRIEIESRNIIHYYAASVIEK